LVAHHHLRVVAGLEAPLEPTASQRKSRLMVLLQALEVEVGRQLLEVGRQLLEVGRQLLEVGRQLLEVGRQLLEVGKQLLEVGKQLLDCWVRQGGK